jgi:NADH oxidase (H2O2-forming)
MNKPLSQIVIIGNGVAGNSAASAIRKVNKKIPITLISEEPFPEYTPSVLSKQFLSGDISREQVFLKSLDDYRQDGIRAILGQKVFGLDLRENKVYFKKGHINYDRLILATGSKPIVPNIPGIHKRGIFTLKSLRDAERITTYSGEKAVIIGGGAIGVEASLALSRRGWRVCLIELLHWILPQSFDEKPSGMLKEIIEEHGVEILTGDRVVTIEGHDHVESVLTEKRTLKCDLVILALGMRPEVGLAQKAGVHINRLGAVRVNKQMMTNIETVYACGDCAETRDVISGKAISSLLLQTAKQEGKVAGYNSVGIDRGYPGALNISSIDIHGVNGVSIGHTMRTSKHSNFDIIEGVENQCYYRFLIAEEIFVGAQFVGKAQPIGSCLSVILRGDSLDSLRRIADNKNLLYKSPWLYRMSGHITTTL